MIPGSYPLSGTGVRVTRRWCPICHLEVDVHQEHDLVPVCPVAYPHVPGLFVHATCLRTERSRDAYLVRDQPRNLFIGR